MKLRSQLLLLSLVGILPVLVFGAAVVVYATRLARENVQERMVETSRALALAVDRDTTTVEGTLGTLALLPSLARRDFAAFDAIARRVAAAYGGWIVLTDDAGRQLINTREPYGTALPTTTVAAVVRHVIATDQAIVSDLFFGRVAETPVVSVLVPAAPDPDHRYSLDMTFEPQRFASLLLEQRLPPGWVAAVFDRQGLTVARTSGNSRSVGRPATPDFRKAMAVSDQGWIETVTQGGRPVYAAFSRSQHSGWTVAIAAPTAALEAPRRRALLLLGGGGALLFLVAAGLTLAVGRRIATPIAALATAARALPEGVPVPPIATSVDEVNELHRALSGLARAHREREAAMVARREAEAANRAKDEFLAMLGHELRNPLAAITNAVRVLDATGKPDDVGLQAREVIHRQAEHLGRLVDDLLDVARATTGKISLVRQPLDVAAVARRVVTTLRGAGRLDDHEPTIDAVSTWVNADAVRIEQVLLNLLVNAIKYTPRGGRIALSVGPEGHEAVVRVRDTGIGIAPENLEHVFDLFVQGKRSLARSEGGLGIGLTLVKRLVELHGGRVSAESEGRNRGSIFTVRLPATVAPAVRPTAAAETRPSAPRRRVLIVEDNDDARRMMRLLLELEGHEVHEAADGERGLALALAVRPDVAFVDVGLPTLDGYDLAQRVRASDAGRGIVLVALTGYGQPADRVRALRAGFDDHLVKPVDPERLDAILAAAGAPS